MPRTSPAAPVYDVLQSFMLTALTDGRRFSHIERLREHPTISELFGAEWVARHAKPIWGALPDRLSLAGIRRCSQSMGPKRERRSGDNPGKPGRRSFHPLLAVVARTRLCPVYGFRSRRHREREPVARRDGGCRAVARGSSGRTEPR